MMFSNTEEHVKKFDTRLARPTGLSVREHIKQLKVSPLTPLKGASDALCRAYIDAYEHARFGCKVNVLTLIFIHLIYCLGILVQ